MSLKWLKPYSSSATDTGEMPNEYLKSLERQGGHFCKEFWVKETLTICLKPIKP